MELEEARNNLLAMRLLYRLLEDNSLGLQNANSEDLVERARVLLKNMLDTAAERVFETILKIIATQAGISKTSCTSQREKPVSSLQLKPLMEVNSAQSSVKHKKCSRITSQKEEHPQLKLPANKAVPWLFKSSISDKRETERKALRSVGEESSMMQQNLVKAVNLSNEIVISPIKESSNHEQQHNSVSTFHVGEHAKEPPEMFEAKVGLSKEVNETPLLNGIYDIQCNPSASSWVEPQDEEGDFSNDLVNAIKRIESRILALQLCSNLVDFKKNSSCDQSMHKVVNTDTPVVQRNEGISGSRLSSGNSLLEGNGLMNHQASQVTGKGESLTSANAFEEPISTGRKSSSQVANQIHGPATPMEPAKSIGITIHGGSQKGEVGRATQLVSRREKLLSRNGVRLPAQSMDMIDRVQPLNRSVNGNHHLVSQASECIQGLRVPLNQDDLTRRSSMLAGRTTREKPVRRNPVAQSETERRVKEPPHQMVLRPTLLDQRSSEIKVSPHLRRDWKVVDKRGTHKMRALPQNHESEESSSSSRSSASWTSQQSSATSSCDPEDYLPGGTPVHQYISPSPGRTVGVVCDDISEESSDSYSHKDVRSSHRVGSLKSDRSRLRRDPEKTIGRLSGLKNKLGLIFHHHHHHHHHDDGDRNHAKVGHRHSMWNHLHKVFHRKNKHKVLTKRKVQKTRGAAVARVSRTKQVGKFHGLVEGLLRHIQHTKKPKSSKFVRVKGSRNPPRGHSKKLHWWQMLRRRQGVRLNNRDRLKGGGVYKPKTAEEQNKSY